MAGHCFDFDGFAGERRGDEERPIRAIRNAVAAVADAVDDKALGHAFMLAKRNGRDKPGHRVKFQP
jgi:hypothetical protein